MRNVSYYIVAHASKFVPAGSVRISSSVINGLTSVAFKTPQGKKVLLVLNDGSSPVSFNIKYKDAKVVVTYTCKFSCYLCLVIINDNFIPNKFLNLLELFINCIYH